MRRPQHGFGRYFEEVSKGEAEVKDYFVDNFPLSLTAVFTAMIILFFNFCVITSYVGVGYVEII